MDESKKNPLSLLTPMQTFGVGLVGGVLVLCTIGFFILLGYMMRGGTSRLAANVNNNADAVTVPTEDIVDTNTGSKEINVKPVDLAKDHITGNKNAKVTIIEFSDTECPFCKRFQTSMQEVMKKYGDKIRWVYRHFPLDQLHSKSRNEALATECASEQGKFWEYIDKVYATTPANDGLDPAQLTVFAKDLKLNMTKFQSCMDTKKYAQLVSDQQADGEAAGVQGTPFSVVIGPNGEKEAINGALPTASIEQVLDKYVK